jgi:hypothetical protein
MNAVVLQCARVRKGKTVSEPIRVSFADAFPAQLPTLTIESEYRPAKDDYRCTEVYSVEEFPCSGDFDGRGFRLKKRSSGDTRDVFLHRNGQEMLCDCNGFSRWNYCKHCEAVRHLVAVDAIADPLHRPEYDLPEYPWPEGCDPFVDDVYVEGF